MKLLLTALMLTNTWNAHALPVMNMNTPGATQYTFYPDHENPNLFYIAPNQLVLARDSHSEAPLFSWIEYRVGGVREATINAFLIPLFSTETIQEAQNAVIALNPNATFTSLPFVDSEVRVLTAERLTRNAHCGDGAGQSFDQQSCVINLNHRGRRVLRRLLQSGSALSAHFLYKVRGVVKNADGTYSDTEISHQLSGSIGGPELRQHPQLFRDHWGRIIE